MLAIDHFSSFFSKKNIILFFLYRQLLQSGVPFLDLAKSVYYISINLLVFYHECHPLIGYATHVLFNN